MLNRRSFITSFAKAIGASAIIPVSGFSLGAEEAKPETLFIKVSAIGIERPVRAVSWPPVGKSYRAASLQLSGDFDAEKANMLLDLDDDATIIIEACTDGETMHAVLSAFVMGVSGDTLDLEITPTREVEIYA